MRTSENKLSRFLNNQIFNSFSQVITDLDQIEESASFLKDFFTESELETFTKRLAIAYWLKKGRSYVNIKTNLKVSSATIAEVAQMMKKKGFASGVKKMEAEEWANKWAEKIRKLVNK
jgi:TrpR-related protein YerC/YecD